MTLRPLFSLSDELAAALDDGAHLLTPNRRLSRALRDAAMRRRADRGDLAWLRGEIMPHRQYWLDAWNHRVTRGMFAPRVVLPAPMQRLLWQQVIEDDPRGFSLLNTARAAALCQEAHERLELWCLNPEDRALTQAFSFGADSEAFLIWARTFREALRERSQLTPEQAVAELATAPRDESRDILMLQLDDLPPLYQRVATACGARDLSPASSTPARCEPLRAYSDKRQELAAAAAWCRQRHDEDPEGRYAVVLSDMEGDRAVFETLLRRAFDCLTVGYERLPVNFATGFRLDRVPLVRDALQILDLAGDPVTVDGLIGVLQSRFLADFEAGAKPMQACVDRLRDLGQARIPQFLLRGILAEAFAPGSAPWDRARERSVDDRLLQRKLSPAQWIKPLQGLLDAWGWPRGQSLDSLEYQQLQHWQQALESFAALDVVLEPLSYGDCVARLRSHMSDQQFQPQTPDRGLQVLGPLETTGLSFDGLWVTGMDSQHWPGAASPNPYLPTALQRAHRMPHCDSAWEQDWSETRWQQWLAGAAVLHTSYVNQADDAQVPPSPLLAELPRLEIDTEAALAPWRSPEGDEGAFEDVALAPVPLTAEEQSRGAGSGIIEDQSLCPFRAFARGRLRTAPVTERAAGLFPWERGQLLHRALHYLYGVIPDQKHLQDCNDGDIERVVSAALEDALKGLGGARRSLLGSEILDLEHRRMAGVLNDWLAMEKQRSVPFTVIGREKPRELQLAGLTLHLRIDRKDELEDGRTLIIDYKTGKPETLKRWFEPRPQRPQLLLYALLDTPADGIAYGSLRPGEAAFSGVGDGEFATGINAAAKYPRDDDPREMTMDLHRENWRGELEMLAREYVSGENRIAPQGDACNFCGRQALCRIDELRP